jgi:trehalose/maltose hydrolase-like predicted phosphorylase
LFSLVHGTFSKIDILDHETRNSVYLHMEYYSSIKKNKITSFAKIWMELEITILSKISQAQKAKYHIFTHMQNLGLK